MSHFLPETSRVRVVNMYVATMTIETERACVNGWLTTDQRGRDVVRDKIHTYIQKYCDVDDGDDDMCVLSRVVT